jgi:hypothetical protein
VEERIVVIRSLARRTLAVGGALAAAAGALALAVGVAGASGSTAHAARTVSLNDTGNLHKTGKQGFNLYESGNASGSVSGSVSMHLKLSGTTKFTAELTVHTKGSSVSGKASGSYRVNGGTGTYSGTLSITGGSGSYSGAHGSGISFSGTIQRSNDAVTVHVNGKFSS